MGPLMAGAGAAGLAGRAAGAAGAGTLGVVLSAPAGIMSAWNVGRWINSASLCGTFGCYYYVYEDYNFAFRRFPHGRLRIFLF